VSRCAFPLRNTSHTSRLACNHFESATRNKKIACGPFSFKDNADAQCLREILKPATPFFTHSALIKKTSNRLTEEKSTPEWLFLHHKDLLFKKRLPLTVSINHPHPINKYPPDKIGQSN